METIELPEVNYATASSSSATMVASNSEYFIGPQLPLTKEREQEMIKNMEIYWQTGKSLEQVRDWALSGKSSTSLEYRFILDWYEAMRVAGTQIAEKWNYFKELVGIGVGGGKVEGRPSNFESLSESDQKRVNEILTIPDLTSFPQNQAIIDYFVDNFLKGLSYQGGVFIGDKHGTGSLQCKPWLQEVVVKKATQVGLPVTLDNHYEWKAHDRIEAIVQLEAGEKSWENGITNNSILAGDIIQMHYELLNGTTPHTAVIWKIEDDGVWVFDTNFGTLGEWITLEDGTAEFLADNTIRLHKFSFANLNTKVLNATIYRVV